MDINTLLSERLNFNNFLFSMSFPDIVNYIEKNPKDIPKVEWDLFTNPSVRISKNIDNYPELILRHPNWPWRFNISQVQNELNRKITELNRLSKPKTSSMLSVSNNQKDNWIDKIINSMEKLCEIQNKIKIQDSEILLKQFKKDETIEKKIIDKKKKNEKQNLVLQEAMIAIANQEMPPDDVGDLKMEKLFHESDEESDDFEEEDSMDMDEYCAKIGYYPKNFKEDKKKSSSDFTDKKNLSEKIFKNMVNQRYGVRL